MTLGTPVCALVATLCPPFLPCTLPLILSDGHCINLPGEAVARFVRLKMPRNQRGGNYVCLRRIVIHGVPRENDNAGGLKTRTKTTSGSQANLKTPLYSSVSLSSANLEK